MFWVGKFSQSNKMARTEFMKGIQYLKKEDVEKQPTFKMPYDEIAFMKQQWFPADVSFNTIVASEASDDTPPQSNLPPPPPPPPPYRLPVGKT